MRVGTPVRAIFVGTVVGSSLLLAGVRCGGDSTGPGGRGVAAVITAPASVGLGCGGSVEVNYSSTESTGAITSRQWRDDEGTLLGSGATLDRTFVETGSARTLLQVCAEDDVCDDDSHTLQINPPTACVPEAIITGDELLRLSEGGSVTARYYGDRSQAAKTFVWSLDGDSIGEGPTVDITLTAPGDYVIGLVIDGDFGTDTATFDIKAFPYVSPPTNITRGDFSFTVGKEPTPNGLFFSGTHWFVGGIYWDSVFVYDADGSYTGTSWYPGPCSGIDGIDGDSEYIYTVCGSQRVMYISRHDGTYVDEIDISDGPLEGFGLAYTGSKWIVGEGPIGGGDQRIVYIFGPDKTLESTLNLYEIEGLADLDYDPSTGWLLVYDVKDDNIEHVMRFYEIDSGKNIFNFNNGETSKGFGMAGIWIDDADYTKVYTIHSGNDMVKEWNVEQ